MAGWRGHLAGLAVAAAMVAGAGASFLAFGSGSSTGVPTPASEAGTCHAAADSLELWWTASDTSPPVPCDWPHQTETMWTEWISGPLASVKRRPNPELLKSQLTWRCEDFSRVGSYLGADDADAHWGVDLLPRFPTPAEWSRGQRLLRCEVLPSVAGSNQPVISQSLRGVLRRAGSARFRLCRSAGAAVSCEQRHDSEAVNPWPALANGPWPGEAALQQMAVTACGPVADRYLGVPLTTRHDLVATADLPTQTQWDQGRRTVQCWLANTAGRVTTGTVRGGLR